MSNTSEHDDRFKQYTAALLAMMPIDELTRHLVQVAFDNYTDRLCEIASSQLDYCVRCGLVEGARQNLIEQLEGLADYDGPIL